MMHLKTTLTTAIAITTLTFSPLGQAANQLPPAACQQLASAVVLKTRQPLTTAELAALAPDSQQTYQHWLTEYQAQYQTAFAQGVADGCQGTWQRPTEWQDPVRPAGYQAGFDLAYAHQPAPATAKPAATAPQPAPSSAPQPGAPAEVPPTAAPPAPTGAVDQQTYPARPLTPHQRAFIEQLVPAAQAIGQAHDLYPSVLLAQAALESNFGTSDLAVNHHNYFGIKGQYRAQGVTLPTVEHLNGQDVTVLGTFRHYPDEQAALADYAQVLAQPTYAGVHRHVATTYRKATQALRGTYATDPNYDRKLNQLIDTYQLTQYDRATPPVDSATPPTHRARPTAPQTSPSPTVATALKANWTWPVLGGAGSVGIVEVLRRLWH